MTAAKSNADLPELDIPEAVREADEAVEMLRAWIADGTMMLALNGGAFGDSTGDWGRLLGEIGQHAARAMALQGHMAEHDALRAIHEAFDQTISRPQPAMSGAVRGRVSH